MKIFFHVGLLTLIGIAAYAQAPLGTITGTITDSSGAVIAGAAVSVTEKTTNVARSLTANGAGLFSAPALPPGDYAVRAESEGFQTVVRDAQVVAGGTTTVNFAMSLGATREVVTVEAATAQINYDSHTIAGVIPRETILVS